jgi:threonine/homoserine/homoserine lactone efflux protein
VVAVFALAATQKFLSEHQVVILLVGGALLMGVGLNMALKDPFRRMRSDGTSRASAADFLQALFMTMTNPGAIFVMFALFAFFGITEDSPSSWRVAPIILSVASGSVTYWFLLSWSLGRFRNKFTMSTLLWVSRVTGALVVIVGITLLTKALFSIIFLGAPIQ